MAGAAAGRKPGSGKDGRSVPCVVDGGVVPLGGLRSSTGSPTTGAVAPTVEPAATRVAAPVRTALSGAEVDVADLLGGVTSPFRAV
jgi:hypothetical protein